MITKTPPYRSRSIDAATREVRRLRKLRDELMALLEQYAAERKALARLAADKPQFFNPLEAIEAKRIRDEILKHLPGANL